MSFYLSWRRGQASDGNNGDFESAKIARRVDHEQQVKKSTEWASRRIYVTCDVLWGTQLKCVQLAERGR